jgi:hypothetical protein
MRIGNMVPVRNTGAENSRTLVREVIAFSNRAT